ncbi:MAG TPA: hypothetical protein VF765_35610 [Polyangiaceae bacterium]
MPVTRFTLMGVGAMRSPAFAPAGLLVEHGHYRVMFDGGPGAEPAGRLDAWLVTDARAELIREIRALAWRHRLEPEVDDYVRDGLLRINPEPVVHTSHPTYGYRIALPGLVAAWAPEFLEFPSWAEGVDLMFADGSGWSRPIRFVGGAGGHACVLDVAREAEARGVERLVFAHIGRPTIRAAIAGERPPFGDLGHDGQTFRVLPASRVSPPARSSRVVPQRFAPDPRLGSHRRGAAPRSPWTEHRAPSAGRTDRSPGRR